MDHLYTYTSWTVMTGSLSDLKDTGNYYVYIKSLHKQSFAINCPIYLLAINYSINSLDANAEINDLR